MTEEFLHYIWKFRLFENLSTTSIFNTQSEKAEDIKIINVGEHNTNAGPDFINTKIKIGDTIWAGNVEIHINTSDWFKHNHHKDKAYKNIILHVVYNNDKLIKRNENEIIPTIELKGKFNAQLYDNYKQFMLSKLWIACQNQINSVDKFTVDNWLESILIKRLERKVEIIKNTLELNNNNWEQTFYQYLARNFGLNVNGEPFELLAKSLPMAYLAKHKNSLFQIEAILFGQAGLLNEKYRDNYPENLYKEYVHLKQKFSLKPIDEHLWKFLRLRPSNFPTIRIAQFANLIYLSSGLFSKIIESKKISEIKKIFDISCSEYWENHYIFDKISIKRKKSIGENTIYLIIINTIIPFLFLYGMEKDNALYKNKALQFLEQIPGENNSVIKRWKNLGLQVNTAFNTQALLELKKSYCDNKKCLNCRIGNFLLRCLSASTL